MPFQVGYPEMDRETGLVKQHNSPCSTLCLPRIKKPISTTVVLYVVCCVRHDGERWTAPSCGFSSHPAGEIR